VTNNLSLQFSAAARDFLALYEGRPNRQGPKSAVNPAQFAPDPPGWARIRH
jgi:hypothetical protein